MKIRRGLPLALFLVSAMLLAACSKSVTPPPSPPSTATGPEADLIAKAKAEGQVVLYSSMGDGVLTLLTDGFSKKYGFKAQFVRKTTAQIYEQYNTEASAGMNLADLFQVPETLYMEELKGKGSLASVDVPMLATWPKKFWTGQYALFSISPWGIMYNTDLVKPANVPKDWKDLLKPEFKGKIGLQDPERSAGVVYAFSMLKDLYGWDFLNQLGKQASTYQQSSTPAAQMVAAGEIAIYVPGTLDAMIDLQKQGAPVSGVVPNTATGAERWIAVLAKAPHPNAARLFLNYCLSPEGQELINGKFGTISPLTNVPGAASLPADYRQTNWDQARIERDEIIKRLKPAK